MSEIYECHECGWTDLDKGFFTEEAGFFYCSLHRSLSWGELAQLTHTTQVERFGWCSCEDNEGNKNPFSDCPKGDK